MSSVKISSNASGTAVFEITSPATSTNRTQALPDAAGIFVLDQAVQSLTNKSFDSAPFATVSGTAPIYPTRAWVNFNGTLPAASMIRASGNVTSITDVGTGQYTVNFTTAMPDANYAVSVNTGESANITVSYPRVGARAAGSFGFDTYTTASALQDPVQVSVAIFR